MVVQSLTVFDLQRTAHGNSKAAFWWHDPITGMSLLPDQLPDNTDTAEAQAIINAWFPYVIATKIALIHSEVSEALEGYRSDKMDDKLPHRLMIEVELADTMIRIGDLAECLKLDLSGAIVEKFQVNGVRPDHKIENRRKPGGKKF